MLSLFESKDAAREKALHQSRQVIRLSSKAIRSAHRGEMREAEELNKTAAILLSEIHKILSDHQDVRYAGFVDDAEAEHAEAIIVLSLIAGAGLPAIDEVGVSPVNYLCGLGDATGELRRHILDLIRLGRATEGEPFLQAMEEIFHLLMMFDFPDGVTRGLRRKGDLARAMLDRTRGDLSHAIVASELSEKLDRANRG
jgi:translin